MLPPAGHNSRPRLPPRSLHVTRPLSPPPVRNKEVTYLAAELQSCREGKQEPRGEGRPMANLPTYAKMTEGGRPNYPSRRAKREKALVASQRVTLDLDRLGLGPPSSRQLVPRRNVRPTAAAP